MLIGVSGAESDATGYGLLVAIIPLPACLPKDTMTLTDDGLRREMPEVNRDSVLSAKA